MQNSAKLDKSSKARKPSENKKITITRAEYYNQIRLLAQKKRQQYQIVTSEINIPAIQRIYKQEGIKIDRRDDLSAKIRAAYFCDDSDYSVLLNKKLPREPKLFSLVHELKHHYVDQHKIQDGEIRCGDYNANQVIEVAAEVFAAEFIYPEAEMLTLIQSLGIGQYNCNEKSVIDIKKTAPVPISYKFVVKRLEWFGLVPKGSFSKTQFQKLEEKIYGKPFYKQQWYKNY